MLMYFELHLDDAVSKTILNGFLVEISIRLIFRDRAGDERKDEYSRLEAVIEKHQGLIPRVLETQVKSEVSKHFLKIHRWPTN